MADGYFELLKKYTKYELIALASWLGIKLPSLPPPQEDIATLIAKKIHLDFYAECRGFRIAIQPIISSCQKAQIIEGIMNNLREELRSAACKNIKSLSKAQLQVVAKFIGCKGCSDFNMAQLIQLISKSLKSNRESKPASDKLSTPPDEYHEVLVDLKQHTEKQIADGLKEIVKRHKVHNKGMRQLLPKLETSLSEVAHAVTEYDHKDPDALYSSFRELQKGEKALEFIKEAFYSFRFQILWDTNDGFPLMIQEDFAKRYRKDEFIRRIWYRLQKNPSPAHWKGKVMVYKEQVVHQLDEKWSILPDWCEFHEDTKVQNPKSYLEDKLSTCSQKLQDRNPSDCKNACYFFTIDFGKHLSKISKSGSLSAIRCRHYAGIARDEDSLGKRWGGHFSTAKTLIDFLLKSKIVPLGVPGFTPADIAVALAVVENLQSTLFYIGQFEGDTAASRAKIRILEKEVIKELSLKDPRQGLNVQE